jgi:hypothetical protein
MNLPQAKTQLEKIIALYKSMSADEAHISSLERDLMLGYIRQLYETFLDGAPASISTPPPVKVSSPPVVPPKVTAPPPPPVVEQPRVAPPPPVVEPPRVEAAPPPPPPVVEPARYTPPPVAEQPRIEMPPPPRFTPPPVQESYRAASSASVPAEITALFDEVSGKELSDKLSNTPITDLTKAFGLNDRLLTINELFGGNKPTFDEAVKDINNASSFETAKGYIIEFAKRYNWTANADRQKQARIFIKLVRRRFK